MERHILFALLMGLLFFSNCVTSIADTDSTKAVSPQAVVNTPQRGMTMADVEKTFGAPLRKIAPVGDPPISRWVYTDFTVYFERQRVIHAVLTAAPR